MAYRDAYRDKLVRWLERIALTLALAFFAMLFFAREVILDFYRPIMLIILLLLVIAFARVLWLWVKEFRSREG